MRRAGKTDTLHASIRDALRRVGCSVHDTSSLGGGFPDLLVWRGGQYWLIEVKSARGRLTEAQERFCAYFPETHILTSVEQALRCVGRSALIHGFTRPDLEEYAHWKTS